MLFRRRTEPGLLARVRVALWPRRSWLRSFRYYAKRVMRLSGTPHAIAAGVAAGVFASFTPFIGLHFILGFFIAFLVGGNLIAAAFGTAFGNPLTFPFIWAATHRVGSLVLGRHGAGGAAIDVPADWAERSFDALAPIIGPMVVGSVPLGVPAALAFYIGVLYSVRGFQKMRRERLAKRPLPDRKVGPGGNGEP